MLGRFAFRRVRANALRIDGNSFASRSVGRRPTGAMHRMFPSRAMIRHQFNQAGPKPSAMDKLREAYREHPILLPAGFVSVFISFLFLGYVNYVYLIQILTYHTFPEPVAKELRKAIYYDTGYGKDPKKALHYYKEALMVATDVGLNPFSEEFIGIRIKLAEFLERHEQYKAAIIVLEREREYCDLYMEKASEKEDVPQVQWDRIVAMAVKVGMKLGKLYSNEEVDNPEAAQEAIVLAVETFLKENIRREKEGVIEGAKPWLSSEEIGASLEELGHTYLNTDQPELALPLFLQALSLCPPTSCHTAMLMNQVSAALSLQKPAAVPPLETPKKKSAALLPTVKDLQNQAKLWAEKGLATAQAISPPERTEECDIACAVITHNLAELAEMSGDRDTAARMFQEAKNLSKAIGFQDGVKEASKALQRFQSSPKT